MKSLEPKTRKRSFQKKIKKYLKSIHNNQQKKLIKVLNINSSKNFYKNSKDDFILELANKKSKRNISNMLIRLKTSYSKIGNQTTYVINTKKNFFSKVKVNDENKKRNRFNFYKSSKNKKKENINFLYNPNFKRFSKLLPKPKKKKKKNLFLKIINKY